ncbi:MAG: hypothetical protein JWP07_3409, partial [Pseudonocardiales bacterium]|nr:hypothetical protein [Pseudonocardiales bacterium]
MLKSHAACSRGGSFMRIVHRLVRRLCLFVVLFGLGMSAFMASASAHAQLEGSDPAPNDVLSSAPQRVTLTFGESVEIADESIQVFNDHLKRVDVGTVASVDSRSNRIQVGLRPGLARGTYVVSWHVSSSDTHPVSGTFRFSIGAPSAVTGKVPGAGRNDTASFLLGIMRSLGYLGLIMGPGILLVTLALWPAGLADVRTRRMLSVGLGLLLVSALGSMVLQGVWASSRAISAIWSAPSSLDTHSRRFDVLYALRFYLLVAFAGLLFTLLSARTAIVSRISPAKPPAKRSSRGGPPAVRPNRLVGPALRGAAVPMTLGLMSTWSLAGHAAAGMQSPVAVVSDVMHLGAMSVWLGGLALLVVSLRPPERAADLRAVLPRFSKVALACVLVLVTTGGYQSWRDVGSFGALIHTTFGRLLLVKIAIVVVVLGLGNIARRWVHRNLVSAPAPTRPGPLPTTARGSGGLLTLERPATENLPLSTRNLQRGLIAESVIGLLVLVITAALVVTVPARASYVKPYQRTATVGDVTLSVRVDERRVGDTILHVKVKSADGRPSALTALRGSLTRKAGALGPLPLRLPDADGATATGSEDIGLTFPAGGAWTLQLTVQTS